MRDHNLTDSRRAFVLKRFIKLYSGLGSVTIARWLLTIQMELPIRVQSFCRVRFSCSALNLGWTGTVHECLGLGLAAVRQLSELWVLR
jgi:hypothetical protein